jgi:hypothetical protein
MICCDGYFYCLIEERRCRIPKILIFSIQDAGEMRFWVQPMPELLENNVRRMYGLINCASRLLENNGRRMYGLITRGSRLLMMSNNNGLVIIWEFHKNPSDSSWRWEEIARMPEFLKELLNWSAHAFAV